MWYCVLIRIWRNVLRLSSLFYPENCVGRFSQEFSCRHQATRRHISEDIYCHENLNCHKIFLLVLFARKNPPPPPPVKLS